MKIGKEVHFEADAEDLLGPIHRTPEAIDEAIALLSDKTESAIQALFWFHSTGWESPDPTTKFFSTDHEIVKDLNLTILEDYKDFINIAVRCLAKGNFPYAAKYYTRFIESGGFRNDFLNAYGIRTKPYDEDDYSIIKPFINRLVTEYPNVNWWNLYLHFFKNMYTFPYVKEAFEDIAIKQIKKNIEEASHRKRYGEFKVAEDLKANCAVYVNILQPLDGMHPSAKGQIVLDKLCDKLIEKCKEYYQYTKSDDEFSVLPTLKMVNYALLLASSNKILKKVKDFKKELEEDVKTLPPKEVLDEANAIKQEIKKFCKKNDDVKWSLELVRNCIPYLREIRFKVGKENLYFIKISTRIADNAIYICFKESFYKFNVFIKVFGLRTNERERLLNAWMLVLFLKQFELKEDFRENKLNRLKRTLKENFNEYHVDYSDIQVDNLWLTDEDFLSQFKDYDSLAKFCLKHPDSIYIKAAINKKQYYEWKEYPKIVTLKSLLEYEEKYPHNYLTSFILSILEKMLEDPSKWSFYDYKRLLALFPEIYEKPDLISQIDEIVFTHCHSLADFKFYVSLFKNGIHIKEAKDKIDDIIFSLCHTKENFVRYIIDYPSGRHYNEALSKLEYIEYQNALRSGDYTEYFRRFPHGLHAEELRRKKDEEFYEHCKKAKDYEEYLILFPNGIYAKSAKRKVYKNIFRLFCKSMKLSFGDILRKPAWSKVITVICFIIFFLVVSFALTKILHKDDFDDIDYTKYVNDNSATEDVSNDDKVTENEVDEDEPIVIEWDDDWEY
ncbi:MAG: hypothetical protein LUC91_03845 [Prevotella sp.]|nr:hypothetical protein [Prevotella sp.]